MKTAPLDPPENFRVAQEGGPIGPPSCATAKLFSETRNPFFTFLFFWQFPYVVLQIPERNDFTFIMGGLKFDPCDATAPKKQTIFIVSALPRFNESKPSIPAAVLKEHMALGAEDLGVPLVDFGGTAHKANDGGGPSGWWIRFRRRGRGPRRPAIMICHPLLHSGSVRLHYSLHGGRHDVGRIRGDSFKAFPEGMTALRNSSRQDPAAFSARDRYCLRSASPAARGRDAG